MRRRIRTTGVNRTRRDHATRRSRSKRYPARRRKVFYEANAARAKARPYGSDGLERLALQAGREAAAGRSEKERSEKHMQQSYNLWYLKHGAGKQRGYSTTLRISKAFAHGYAAEDSLLCHYIPLPLSRTTAAVVVASNERGTLNAVLEELKRLPFGEIVVVLNGCTDGSFTALEHDPRLIKLSYPQRLGHDVGRALGAAMTAMETVLFVDGDMRLPAEDLGAFLVAIEQGSDVALNDITPLLPSFMKRDSVTYSKMFLNMSLGRSDLSANSLTAVPHALSRRAIDTLGHGSLIVPPKAHALAIAHGLVVTAPYSVNVVKNNRIRSTNTGPANAVSGLILGDHIEALAEVMKMYGPRLKFTRMTRSELAKVRNGR
ncbi:glycosyltransferase [Paenibacillus sp. 79R4]|uniref:glycosyltransferase family 2 protein n=1 Tax=Paenibacillus sp. 79R4 TaxID=2212847 RepID=UPI0021189875|nr:glycosyltransferase [Paenibacillus sp. 79R4]